MTFTLHKIVSIFPRMPADEFEVLVADIRAHGIRQPILVHAGQILDGRHRWEAARGTSRTRRRFASRHPISSRRSKRGGGRSPR
ncbi:MAG: ParB N-terminal domain-containing protein [Deltaproteobacteria bacterium]|nr:ParB N-terminal domain-containing protein [Deltaproteobacteria bacterium]